MRALPYAGAMIVFAIGSSALVARLGTKRVVTAGMLLFAAGLAVAATVSTDSGYGLLAIAMVLMGAGMGLAGAPATESIMGSLPPERANIGSAVNDTTRELGGALGVAIVGSVMSSLYAAQLSDTLPDSVPPAAAEAARESLGAGAQMGPDVANAAREAFVHAMSGASLVVAIVAALGAVIAWRYLPARRGCRARQRPSRAGPDARRGRLMTIETAAAVLLIVTPLWFNTTFRLAERAVRVPDILRRPAGEILERFHAGGASLILLWWAFMLSGLLLIASVVLLGRALGTSQQRQPITAGVKHLLQLMCKGSPETGHIALCRKTAQR